MLGSHIFHLGSENQLTTVKCRNLMRRGCLSNTVPENILYLSHGYATVSPWFFFKNGVHFVTVIYVCLFLALSRKIAGAELWRPRAGNLVVDKASWVNVPVRNWRNGPA